MFEDAFARGFEAKRGGLRFVGLLFLVDGIVSSACDGEGVDGFFGLLGEVENFVGLREGGYEIVVPFVCPNVVNVLLIHIRF